MYRGGNVAEFELISCNINILY